MTARDFTSGHAPCDDCIRCDACPNVAYCLAERPATMRPCLHDKRLCGDCNLDFCAECRLAAFSGELPA